MVMKSRSSLQVVSYVAGFRLSKSICAPLKTMEMNYNDRGPMTVP